MLEKNLEINLDLNIDKAEVLRYLGHNGQSLNEDLDRQIDDCINETKNKVEIKYTYDVYDIEKNLDNTIVKFKNTNFEFDSKDVTKLLEDCDKCVLMSATLGFNIEKEIRRYSYKDLTRGLIIDACATTSIEEVCDIIQDSIFDEVLKEEKSLTMRYSPGYGDLDIRVNRDILNLLNAQRKIGLTVTGNGIMMPRKSVVALIGISNHKKDKVKRSCDNCPNREKCKYSRKVDGCGIKTIYEG